MYWDLIIKVGLMVLGWALEKHQNKEQVLKMYQEFVKQLSPFIKAAAEQSLKIEDLLIQKQKEIDKKNGKTV